MASSVCYMIVQEPPDRLYVRIPWINRLIRMTVVTRPVKNAADIFRDSNSGVERLGLNYGLTGLVDPKKLNDDQPGNYHYRDDF